MQRHLGTLMVGATLEQRRAIYKDASATEDLMNYSYEVADVMHPEWQHLERMVSEVFAALTEAER